MTRKLLRFFVTVVAFVATTALAQTATPGTVSTPNAPSATPSPALAGAGSTSSTRVGTINIEQAIVYTNEGRRDFDALSKKLEPKQNELKAQNDELEGLQKQLQTQGDKLNEDARSTLVKQIETKKKSFDRSVQDAQEEAATQQNEIAQRILQKMGPIIVKYAQDNGFSMIVDTTKRWPDSPLLWAGDIDITQPVVDAYNAQSGVPAPPSSGAAKPAIPKAVAPKPATPKPAEPPK